MIRKVFSLVLYFLLNFLSESSLLAVNDISNSITQAFNLQFFLSHEGVPYLSIYTLFTTKCIIKVLYYEYNRRCTKNSYWRF
jgi:hypothetical protein